ncbi:MAG TPA: YqhA family protein [Steroidobacteraceae bacterium]|nr:YqhA family protein [Steroidobacteraceae bacterium]
MIKALLNHARYIVIVAVAGSLLASLALIVYGGIEAVVLVVDAIRAATVSAKGAKMLALSFIEVVDLFLLWTVFLIIALGLYELFISSDLKLPGWLVIRTLDDLKNKLVGVVIVVLAVLFLGNVVTWDGERDLLGFGTAVALVIAALTWFLKSAARKPAGKSRSGEAGASGNDPSPRP